MTLNSLARAQSTEGPLVVLIDSELVHAAQAQVRGQSFADLPDLLAAANGDMATIEAGPDVPVTPETLLSPVARPRKVICMGQNYRDHVAETGNSAPPPYPDLFPKWDSSLAGPGQDVVLPPESELVDFETELTVVIGRPARRVPIDDVEHVILGYTVANDVSVRDYQLHTKGRMAGKAWDALTPLGPRVVPATVLGGAHPDLRLTSTLNGETMQDDRTSKLVFDIPAIVSYVSTFLELSPGDLLLTGTPSGVGFFRNPQVMLTDGDVFEAAIEGIGTLRNRFVRRHNDD